MVEFREPDRKHATMYSREPNSNTQNSLVLMDIRKQEVILITSYN
jgi:hypothetical protein